MPGSPKYVPTEEHLEIVRAIMLSGSNRQVARSAIGIGKEPFDREFNDLCWQWRAEFQANREADRKGAMEDRQLQRQIERASRPKRPKNRGRKKPVPPAPPEDIALAEQLVAEGLTQRQIAARMGIKHTDLRFRALKPTFDGLRPERTSSKVELTPEQMALGAEMVRSGAGGTKVAQALGLRPGSTAVRRIFAAERQARMAAAEDQRVPCFICGEVNPAKEPSSQTCSDRCRYVNKLICDLRRKARSVNKIVYERKLILADQYYEKHRDDWFKKYDELEGVETAFVELGIVKPSRGRNAMARRRALAVLLQEIRNQQDGGENVAI